MYRKLAYLMAKRSLKALKNQEGEKKQEGKKHSGGKRKSKKNIVVRRIKQ